MAASQNEKENVIMRRYLAIGMAAAMAVFFTSGAWAGDAGSKAGAKSGAKQRSAPVMENLAGLEVGDDAPDFEFPKPGGKDGEMAKLSDYKGEKNVLLAFYPKAFTGGCTKQLCGYTEDYSRFKDNDTEVIAISTDEQDQSDAFKVKYKMPFIVFGDADKKAIEGFGIPTKAREDASLAQRSVVLIDKHGKIALIDMNYSIDDDKDPLYEKIEEINKAPSEKS